MLARGTKPRHADESGALALDTARRAVALRTISAVLSVGSLLVVLAEPGAPWLVAMQLLSATAFGIVWKTARASRQPERGGLAVVAILLLQQIVSDQMSPRSAEIAYFAGFGPFISAVTARLPGVMLTGIVFALWLATLIGLRLGVPTIETFEPFVTPVVFFIMMCAVSIAVSVASRRALAAQARDAERARAAQDAAHEAQERYGLVSDRMSDLIAVFDSEDNYVYASPSHERALGIKPEDLSGRPDLELVHPDDRERCREAFERARREESLSVVTRLRLADGTYRWFHIGVSRVELGGICRIAVSARDITEQRALADALESTRRMEALGRLAGGVAHDFNNLLFVIESCTDLAAAKIGSDHPAQKELGDLHGAAGRAAALTAQLLTFARRQVLSKVETSSVNMVMRELTPILARIAGPKVTLDVDVEGTDAAVNASPVQLEQIVMNLVSNARDAMPEGGTLTISAHDRAPSEHNGTELQHGSYVAIEVSDTGVGMSDEVQRQIFEPFFTTKPAGHGTGLGLATVFGLVSQLGGRISVRSAPGAGSAFTVLLPASDVVRARERGTTQETRAVPRPQPASPLDVLVVDDEPAVRMLIARMLREAGHRAIEAGSTEAALAEAETPGARFDAIVTDVVVGSDDGIAMLDRVKLSQPDAGIVVISGFSPSPDRVAKVREHGAVFLAKPFGSAELLRGVARASLRSRHSPLQYGS